MSNSVERELENEEDDYNSSEDEDFNPEGDTRAAIASGDSSSESDSESDDDDEETGSKTSAAKRDKTKAKSKDKIADGRASKKTETKNLNEDVDSGDEVVIQTGKRKRDDVSKDKDDDYDGDEADGGEGGLIKTRAQRAKEDAHKQKIPRATTASSTIDVDALWKSMNTDAKPSEKPAIETNESTVDKSAQTAKPISNTTSTGLGTVKADKPETQTSKPPEQTAAATVAAAATASAPEEPLVKDGMVKIKRTYEFAGEVTTEERVVSADSFEARAYLASLSESKQPASGAPSEGAASSGNTAKKPPLRRPTKRTSLFDPANPAKAKATKLTTLEKSRLDWAGYVDREGLGEELDKQKKTGTGYLERRDFLDRVADRTTGRK